MLNRVTRVYLDLPGGFTEKFNGWRCTEGSLFRKIQGPGGQKIVFWMSRDAKEIDKKILNTRSISLNFQAFRQPPSLSTESKNCGA